MKLSITDEFLWGLYDLLEQGHDAVDFLFFTTHIQKANIISGNVNPLFKKLKQDKERRKFSQLIYRAKVRGLIKIKNLQGKSGMMLTEKGISKALRASFIMEGKRKRKDGKWLMVIFDIPQAHKKSRGLVRSILRNLGYKMFQQSVWVTPFDVYEKTEKLFQVYSLDEYVRIFLIEELDIS